MNGSISMSINTRISANTTLSTPSIIPYSNVTSRHIMNVFNMGCISTCGTHFRYDLSVFTHNPPHEQLLMRLGVGGVSFSAGLYVLLVA